jgi:Protein of unknown function/Domain of unknown function (DUF1835)
MQKQAMIYHLVCGDLAATPIQQACTDNDVMTGEVVVMKDVLSVGPLQRDGIQSFSALRSEFWQKVAPYEKAPIEVNDLERLLEVGNALSKNPSAQAWIWIAPLPADVCMYLWCLQYLEKYAERLNVVNIAGLPFLDAESRMFFPKSIAEIRPEQILKAAKLARPLNQTELEMDHEEWDRLVHENGGLRTLEGGKKIHSRPENYYDTQLIGFCTHQFQKAAKVAGQAIARFGIPTGDYFLGWRLRELFEAGKLIAQGDPNGKLKDWEIKIPGEDQQLELGI